MTPRMQAPTIRELPVNDRPRERLMRHGPEALSEQELLACVLGRGVTGDSVLVSAQRLLGRFKSLRGVTEASIEALATVRGIGPAKAAQLKASAELSRRVATPLGPRPRIDSTAAAAAVVRPLLADKAKEHVVGLLLTNRHDLIRVCPIAVGTLSASLVHPREVFKEAIAASAAALLVAHNHPSGDPEPSEADVALTRRLAEAGAMLGIELLDHLILGGERVVSLRALGLWPGAPRRRTRRQPA